MLRFIHLPGLIALLAIGGCTSPKPPPPTPPEIERDHLPFIRDGATTREQVLLQLGIPSAQFEGERILTYRLFLDGNVLKPVMVETAHEDPRYRTWTGPAFNLVLVFDARNVLQRHGLIQVR